MDAQHVIVGLAVVLVLYLIVSHHQVTQTVRKTIPPAAPPFDPNFPYHQPPAVELPKGYDEPKKSPELGNDPRGPGNDPSGSGNA